MPPEVWIGLEKRAAWANLGRHRRQRNWHTLKPLGARNEYPPIFVDVDVLAEGVTENERALGQWHTRPDPVQVLPA